MTSRQMDDQVRKQQSVFEKRFSQIGSGHKTSYGVEEVRRLGRSQASWERNLLGYPKARRGNRPNSVSICCEGKDGPVMNKDCIYQFVIGLSAFGPLCTEERNNPKVDW